MSKRLRRVDPLLATLAAGLLVWGCTESTDAGVEAAGGDRSGGVENGGASSGGAGLGGAELGGAAGSRAEPEPMECKGSFTAFCSNHFCPTSVDTFSKELCSDQLRVVVDSVEQWETTCGTKVIVVRDVDTDWYWYYFDEQEQLIAAAAGTDLGGCEYGTPPCVLNRTQTEPAATLCYGRSLPTAGAGGQGGQGGRTGQSTPVSCRYCELD